MKGVLLFLLTALLGCTTPKVVTTTNPEVDFSLYKTFRVVNALKKKGAPDDSYAGHEKIEVALNTEMEQRGYLQATSKPDLFVTYRVIIDTKISYRVDRYNPGYTGYYPPPYSRVRQSRFNEGLLLVELVERGTNRKVWQGSLDLRVNRKKKSTNFVAESVKMIFAKYPYLAGRKDPVVQNG